MKDAKIKFGEKLKNVFAKVLNAIRHAILSSVKCICTVVARGSLAVRRKIRIALNHTVEIEIKEEIKDGAQSNSIEINSNDDTKGDE